MSTLTAVERRQRATPPIDRRHNRRGLSGGGYDTAHPMTIAPGIESELPRYPGTTNDAEIHRDRAPWYNMPDYPTVGNGWVNWTLAGPPRAELHMRNATWRPMEGNSRSRFPFLPQSPTGGMHTMIPSGPGSVRQTAPRYQSGNPQMQAARVDRLAGARYAGQSYSQTTSVQGARGRGSRR
jgi:hypothetical protein